MGNWNNSNPCKNCGRKSGSMLKCTNCGTLGCNNGNCGIGQVAKSSHCKICNKATETVRV